MFWGAKWKTSGALMIDFDQNADTVQTVIS